MNSNRFSSLAATISIAALACLTLPAVAGDIYKCPTAAGKVEFRDRPCDGAAGEKFKAKDNSIGMGDDLAGIRAKDAALKARQVARQDAEDKANAEAYAAREKAFQQERVHQDAVALQEAIRESGNAQAAANYNARLVRQPEQQIKVEIVNRPSKAPAAKALPAK